MWKCTDSHQSWIPANTRMKNARWPTLLAGCTETTGNDEWWHHRWCASPWAADTVKSIATKVSRNHPRSRYLPSLRKVKMDYMLYLIGKTPWQSYVHVWQGESVVQARICVFKEDTTIYPALGEGVVKSLSLQTRSLSESCIILLRISMTKMTLALMQCSNFLVLSRPTHHFRECKWKILIPILQIMEKNGFEVTFKSVFSLGFGCQQ